MHILMTLCVPCLLLMLAAGCDESKPAGGTPPQDAKSRPTTGPSAAKTGKADMPVVKLETSEGTIMLELNRVKAPKSVENFLNYVRKGFYEGTTFHRIIANFMIQGGGMTEDGGQKPTDKPIQNEADNGLTNVRGSLAMARTTGSSLGDVSVLHQRRRQLEPRTTRARPTRAGATASSARSRTRRA